MLFPRGTKTTSLKSLFIRFFKISTCFGKLQLKCLRWNRASVIFNHPSRLYFPSLNDGSDKTYFYSELSNISWECIFLYWSAKTSSVVPYNNFSQPDLAPSLTSCAPIHPDSESSYTAFCSLAPTAPPDLCMLCPLHLERSSFELLLTPPPHLRSLLQSGSPPQTISHSNYSTSALHTSHFTDGWFSLAVHWLNTMYLLKNIFIQV